MLFVLVTLAALGSSPAHASSSPVADGQLMQRKYRVAASKYQEALAEHPDDFSLKLGLARAWAGLGWCERALPALEQSFGTELYDQAVAMSLGSCLSDVGRHVEAVAAYEDAVVLTADSTSAQVRLAWEAFIGGDAPVFEATAAAVIAEDPQGLGALLLQAVQAFQEGDEVGMDLYLDQLQERQRRAPTADMLRGWSAMQVGDTRGAVEALRGPTRFFRLNLPDVATWLVEANRQGGEIDSAILLADEQIREREIPPIRQALRLRLTADIDGAASVQAQADALLAALPFEPEVVATAWYLATLQGQRERARALRERYEALRPATGIPLDRLLPPTVEIP